LRCAIAVLSVVAFALAGCGSGGGGSAAQSNHTLTIWMMTGGPVIQDVNKEFATKHPDMKVDIQIQQWDNIVTKLTTALATSKPPDIVEMGNTQNPLQTFAGGLAELTDVKSSFEDSANWLSGLASPSENGGKLYAVPLYGGTKVVMYNKDFSPRQGSPAPPRRCRRRESNRDHVHQGQAEPDHQQRHRPARLRDDGVPGILDVSPPLLNNRGRSSARCRRSSRGRSASRTSSGH
jgi:N,N'-diacetylchitobiose transport system substrate-binding protein